MVPYPSAGTRLYARANPLAIRKEQIELTFSQEYKLCVSATLYPKHS